MGERQIDGARDKSYLIARVEEWCEANAGRLAEAQGERKKRSAQMTEVAQRRRDELIAWAEEVKVNVSAFSPDDLRDEAESWYIWRDYERRTVHGDGDGDYEPLDLGEGALIAFVRHQYTNYEDLLAYLGQKPGCHEAYPVLKAQINEMVKAALREAGVIESPVNSPGQQIANGQIEFPLEESCLEL